MLARRMWDTESTDKSRGEYQEIQHMVKAEMLKAKQGSYDDFYAIVWEVKRARLTYTDLHGGGTEMGRICSRFG